VNKRRERINKPTNFNKLEQTSGESKKKKSDEQPVKKCEGSQQSSVRFKRGTEKNPYTTNHPRGTKPRSK